MTSHQIDVENPCLKENLFQGINDFQDQPEFLPLILSDSADDIYEVFP
ncbi:MAG: hypothetical protein NTY64_18185 [Deltaproteobacteria bacterium]|nr:hypothetical protein [Deltaproteobacteria bacterium]